MEIESFRDFSVFALAPLYVLENMYKYMIKLTYQKGNFIYKEGDKVKYIYFIKDGEVEASF
jgi:CRP-like cAMP-binding protein